MKNRKKGKVMSGMAELRGTGAFYGIIAVA